MIEKQLLNIINQIGSEAFWILLKLIGIGVAILVIKGFIESVAAYIQLRLDERLNIGVKVRVRGVEGKITDYNLSWIIVKHEKGVEVILTRRWRFEKWTIINGDGECVGNSIFSPPPSSHKEK